PMGNDREIRDTVKRDRRRWKRDARKGGVGMTKDGLALAGRYTLELAEAIGERRQSGKRKQQNWKDVEAKIEHVDDLTLAAALIPEGITAAVSADRPCECVGVCKCYVFSNALLAVGEALEGYSWVAAIEHQRGGKQLLRDAATLMRLPARRAGAVRGAK